MEHEQPATNKNDLFVYGFLFGISIMESMTKRVTQEQVKAQLRAVADSDLTLLESIDEGIERIRKESGVTDPAKVKDLEDAFRLKVHPMRTQADKDNAQNANFVLQELAKREFWKS